MRVKLLQCGDIHIDAPFTSLSDANGKAGMRRRDIKQSLSRIVELANSEKADMLLICGDLYEHAYAKKSTIHYICDQFRKIPDIAVLIIPGNHDPFIPGSFYSDFEWPSNVHILKDDTCFYEHPPTGAKVYGALPDNGALDRSAINILMFHGTLDMPFCADAYHPVSGQELLSHGFDYCALGHFHTRLYAAGPDGSVYNAGSPEPLGFDEEGEHGVYISVIEKEPGLGAAAFVNFVKLNHRCYINIDVQVEGCKNSEQAAVLARSAMEGAGTGEDLYRISLTGYIDHDFKIDMELLEDILRSKAFYVKIIDRTVPDYDFEAIARECGIRGLFASKMLAMAAEAVDTDEKELVMQALYYGMEAIDEGKVCV